MSYKLIIILLSLLSFLSCTKDKITFGTEALLEGIWVSSGWEENTLILEKKSALQSDRPGYIFYEDGKLVERKNAGWCGTPPVTYDNFSGEWSCKSSSLIDINVAFWGGKTRYSLEIVAITSNKLKVRQVME